MTTQSQDIEALKVALENFENDLASFIFQHERKLHYISLGNEAEADLVTKWLQEVSLSARKSFAKLKAVCDNFTGHKNAGLSAIVTSITEAIKKWNLSGLNVNEAISSVRLIKENLQNVVPDLKFVGTGTDNNDFNVWSNIISHSLKH